MPWEPTSFGRLYWHFRYWSKTAELDTHMTADPQLALGVLGASSAIRDHFKVGNATALDWAVATLAPVLAGLPAAVVVPVPPSSQGEGLWPVARLAERLASLDGRMRYGTWLRRVRPMPPQHETQGPRSPDIHLATLEVVQGFRAPLVVLLDDVATSLSTLQACSQLLRSAGRAEQILAVTLGRRLATVTAA